MDNIIEQNKEWINDVWDRCEKKLLKTSRRIGDTFPYSTVDGKYVDFENNDIYWWTNGFWPGMLWLLYRETKNEFYRTTAESCEDKLDKALYGYDGLHHDVGFMWMPSSVASYKLTGNEKSRKRAMIAASVLASRYNSQGRFIRAWNGEWNGCDTTGWAIIDCLMNLPLLRWASEQANDKRFSYIADEHCQTVLDHFIRPDGSVNHIVSFNPETGEFIETFRGQGYAVGSSWSRGQSWAIYGFALNYMYTQKQEYLDAAKRVAHYFIANICDDYIPDCDFRAPQEPVIKDSLAGTVTASGLIEIAKYVDEMEKPLYLNAAIKILKALDEKCGLWDSDNEALLGYATAAYHFPVHHENIIYGDYYFIEAVLKLKGSTDLFW